MRTKDIRYNAALYLETWKRMTDWNEQKTWVAEKLRIKGKSHPTIFLYQYRVVVK